VFNGIFWQHLLEGGLPRGSAGRIALPVAGDNAAGKQIVFDLVNELGFDPVDGGTLGESWRQQPGTPVYGTDLDPREQSERSQRPRPNAQTHSARRSDTGAALTAR
jgi:predicted dinucleotide-binding enzyme